MQAAARRTDRPLSARARGSPRVEAARWTARRHRPGAAVDQPARSPDLWLRLRLHLGGAGTLPDPPGDRRSRPRRLRAAGPGDADRPRSMAAAARDIAAAASAGGEMALQHR